MAASEFVNPVGRRVARQLVKNIAKDHGYLGEDVLSQMTPDVRREVEEAMLKKDEMIGSSVMTLAKNLYTSSARFVFELLQNADDNHYTKARGLGELPFVSFRVYSRRIVLDCNEDGFTKANLVAICNVGKSSKTGAQGYIGEKGIGFKSVFMAAWKAHIQSGPFSFSFQHNRGDSGMGMISPIWEGTFDEVAGPLTRITLSLHDTGDADFLAKQRETTLKQFRELQDTILLFMKNIRKIDIAMYDEHDLLISTTTYSMNQEESNRVSITKRLFRHGSTDDQTKYYHITKYLPENLPRNENRTYSEAEEATRAYASAEVILAFPLTKEAAPIIAPQEVFAFLPIRHMGFTFLIQTDFVTQANRQDIVTSSARNVRLVRAVAKAFVKAVSQFCAHRTLQYRWMRYLPQNNDYPWDPFWKDLIDQIRTRLSSSKVLRPRSHGGLRYIEDMRRLKREMLDKNFAPLFSDLQTEQYLASEYVSSDLDRLEEYGLKYMDFSGVIARVERDLNWPVPSLSRMKSAEIDEDWQSRAAKLLSRPFEKNWRDIQKHVRALALLPLTNGEWVSVSTNDVYYCHANDIPVPKDLGLHLLDPRTTENTDRKRLFDYLGVREPSISQIRDLIVAKYNSTRAPANIDLARSRDHLNFLYLSEHGVFISQLRTMWVYDHHSRLRKPFSHDIYLRNTNPYGAHELFKPIEPGNGSCAAAPGLDVSFFHSTYMENPPETPEAQTRGWVKWLKQCLSIKDEISLSGPGGISGQKVLTKELLYIAKHRPERFLGFLSSHWEVGGEEITKEPKLLEELLKIEVLCKGGHMYPLSETYLPTAELQGTALKFLGRDEFFPWLQLEGPLSHDVRPPEWEVLMNDLKAGYPKSDVDFLLAILKFILDANPSAASLTQVTRIYELYESIQSRCHDSNDRNHCRKKIRMTFLRQPSIFVPAFRTRIATWAKSNECLWEAPADMQTKYPLNSLYEAHFRQTNGERTYLTEFFTKTLAIPDVRAEHFLEELRALKSSQCTDFHRINGLYESISKKRQGMAEETIDRFKKAFEDEALIYIPRNGRSGWFKVSHCLWSNATQIRGMVCLNDHYELLEDFFVGFLGARTLNLQMVLDELIEQGRRQSSVEEIKQNIEVLNSFLKSDKGPPSPSAILDSQVFPVRYPAGSVNLRTSTTDFAIADRKHLRSLFSSKAKILDFDINDIPRLEPFFKWTGLDSRYLSSSVKEISTLCGNFDRLVSDPDRDIRRKAHGLLRIAVHFESPRAKNDQCALYELLKNAEVRETDGIRSELHLNQDGRDIVIELERSELHIGNSSSELKIYVPQDEDAQYLCFVDKLPKSLLEWIMADPLTQIPERTNDKALYVMQKVVTSKKYFAKLLDSDGIVSVETLDDSNLTERPDASITSTAPTTSMPAIDRTGPVNLTPSENDSDNDSFPLETPASSVENLPISQASSSHAAATRGPRPVIRPAGHVSVSPPLAGHHSRGSPSLNAESTHQGTDPQYLNLLDKVVTAARRSIFPSQGTFDMSALRSSLTEDTPYYDVGEPLALRSDSQLERDKRIGAAGELFVFEILSHLDPGLPSFSRANWQSTIRKYVTVHQEYSDMQPWNGRETADITYEDRGGVLTALLIDKGYLSAGTWADKKPRYFIEVKSTPGPCDTRFFMSKYQYQRMQDMSNGDSGTENQDSIYVIFRVYNLDQDSINMKVYVDPEVMRRQSRLSFTAESWTVRPGLSTYGPLL